MPIINVSYASRERPQFDPQALAIAGPQIMIDILPPVIIEKWMQSVNIKPKIIEKIPALIDTGASVTGVDLDYLKKLGYPPIGVAELATPSGVTKTQVYMVRIVMPSRAAAGFPQNVPRIIIDNVRVIGVRLGTQKYKALLGRDILSRLILVYNGPQALITLGY